MPGNPGEFLLNAELMDARHGSGRDLTPSRRARIVPRGAERHSAQPHRLRAATWLHTSIVICNERNGSSGGAANIR